MNTPQPRPVHSVPNATTGPARILGQATRTDAPINSPYRPRRAWTVR
ncbi:hypothetical protein [Verrucosispora sp. NA02020]|nr:hypothetical protein [Verrucosispora sp. NA02020]QKW15443.1 hypothetical protein HUT12_23525 [Verrucosispora sp. NA02020]